MTSQEKGAKRPLALSSTPGYVPEKEGARSRDISICASRGREGWSSLVCVQRSCLILLLSALALVFHPDSWFLFNMLMPETLEGDDKRQDRSPESSVQF